MEADSEQEIRPQSHINEVQKMKSEMQHKVALMVNKLDIKALQLQQQYQACFDTKCKPIKPQISSDILPIDDETVFVNTKAAENYCEKIETYNTCVEEC